MSCEFLVLNENDNIGILTASSGKKDNNVKYKISSFSDVVKLRNNIPFGHKVAIRDIRANEPIIKFGQVIGYSSRNILAGEHVHVHNVSFSNKVNFSEAYIKNNNPFLSGKVASLSKLPVTFNGYLRKGGKAGIRNYVLVVSTSNCSATVVRNIADYFKTAKLERDDIDGVIPVIHHGGCTEAEDSYSHKILNRTIAGWIENPNVIGALIVSLGCEGTTFDTIGEFLTQNSLSNSFIDTFDIQDAGGAAKSVKLGIEKVNKLLSRLPDFKRNELPLSFLSVATNCGGSDAFSSLTANPALGIACDILVSKEGTIVLAETTECFGGEELLVNRCVKQEDKEKLHEIFSWWDDYTSKNSVNMNDNISPGNIEGGITTILEKSLGAIAKAGSSPITQVLDYAERITAKGFVFMNTPGFDPVSVTGIVAGGCNLVVFTTGRGSMYGCSIAPTIKISTNSNLFKRFDDIDVDAGDVLKTGDIVECGCRIFQKFIDTANGAQTKSERNRVGMEEFVPWPVGAVL